MFTVVSTPEIGGEYVVKDDVTQETRVVTGTEMRLYIPWKAADVVVDPAAAERDDFTADEDDAQHDDRAAEVYVDPAAGLEADRAAEVYVDPAAGLEADRAANVGVDLAVLVTADWAAHVGVGLTMDEAARADVAAEGDMEPTTRRPAPCGRGDGDRLGEMNFIVWMPAPSVRSFPVSHLLPFESNVFLFFYYDSVIFKIT